MADKNSPYFRMNEYKERNKARGLVMCPSVWIPPYRVEELKQIAARWRAQYNVELSRAQWKVEQEAKAKAIEEADSLLPNDDP